MSQYSKTYEIRFSDIDAAGDLRYQFFTEHGFPPERFEQLGVGPVYTAIHAEFLREVRMGESVTITYALAAFQRREHAGEFITMSSNPMGRRQSVSMLKASSWI